MSLLGKKYPLIASEFLQSGLLGHWAPNMADAECARLFPIHEKQNSQAH